MYIVCLLDHLKEQAAVNRFAEIILSPLHELQGAIISSTADESEVPFLPKRVLRLTPAYAMPTHLTFALHDERLVVGPAKGLTLIYNSRQLLFTSKRSHTAIEGNPAEQCGCDPAVTRKSRRYT